MVGVVFRAAPALFLWILAQLSSMCFIKLGNIIQPKDFYLI